MGIERANKYMKWILRILMLGNLYGVISSLLVLTGKTNFEVIQSPAIFLSFFAFFIASLLIKNIYWILAFAFEGLDTIAQIVASKYFEESKSISGMPSSLSLVLVFGMVCLLLSLFCFYKLLKTPDFISKKNMYKWMWNLDNYLRKKFRSGK